MEGQNKKSLSKKLEATGTNMLRHIMSQFHGPSIFVALATRLWMFSVQLRVSEAEAENCLPAFCFRRTTQRRVTWRKRPLITGLFLDKVTHPPVLSARLHFVFFGYFCVFGLDTEHKSFFYLLVEPTRTVEFKHNKREKTTSIFAK